MTFKKAFGFIFLALIFALNSAILADTGPSGGKIWARLYFADKSQMAEVFKLDLDITEGEYGQYVEFIGTQEDVDRVRTLGYRVEIQIPDMKAFYQERFGKVADMGGYHTFDETVVALDSLHTLYPSITTDKINLGNSLEGDTIWAMKISDNPDADEDEPEVLYDGLHHAREPITIEVLLYFMKYLCQNYGSDSEATYLVNNRELWFVPIVNPDGYEHNRDTDSLGGGLWRKNRRDNGNGTFGVDINRNYGYNWGYDNSGSSPNGASDTYRGTGPFSEPETQVMRDFVNSREFVIALNYHSYGNYFIKPWGYARIYTPDDELFTAIGDTVTHFNGYAPGTGWELLYLTNGDADDWMYGEQTSKPKILPFTPEVGNSSDNFWPPESRIIPLCSLNLRPNLLIASLADNPHRLLRPQPPTLISPGDQDTADFSLSWTFNDSLNPAQTFELVEQKNPQTSLDDAEAAPDPWDKQGFTVSSARAHAGTKSYYGGKADGLDNKLIAAEYIEVQSGDSLTFWTWYNTEVNFDYAYVEISTNNGQSFFTIPGNITTNYNPFGPNLGNGITGSSGGVWVRGAFNLNSWASEQILLRFRYRTDANQLFEGFYVDDIYPTVAFQQTQIVSDTITGNSYNLTGKNAGTYYYKVRAKDQQNQLSYWSNQEKVTVTLLIVGDVNKDGFINLSDIILLVNYVFKGGAAPSPQYLGNVNGDGGVNLGDIIYLVNFIFKGGPPPVN